MFDEKLEKILDAIFKDEEMTRDYLDMLLIHGAKINVDPETLTHKQCVEEIKKIVDHIQHLEEMPSKPKYLH